MGERIIDEQYVRNGGSRSRVFVFSPEPSTCTTPF
jgi:hypothetical protein